MQMSQSDQFYMERAIRLAENAVGQTSPNPAVGAVIVCGGVIVGEGYHTKAGALHAEREAIKHAEEAGFDQWSEATIYCTLEPCSTYGTTGACVDHIKAKGFKRVVYGIRDVHPKHSGNADRILQEAGIEVAHGVLEKECKHLIRGFSAFQTTGLPWVIIKSAMSLDGGITRPEGEGQWLTHAKSREQVHHLRAEVDAIITGGNTVRQDDPSLTVRLEGRNPALRQPLPVILTRDKARLPSGAKLLQQDNTLVYECREGVSFESVLRDLAQNHGVRTVLVEAGGALMGAFVDQKLVDEVVMFYAPLLVGRAHPSVAGQGAQVLEQAMRIEDVQYTNLEGDIMMRGRVVKSPE